MLMHFQSQAYNKKWSWIFPFYRIRKFKSNKRSRWDFASCWEVSITIYLAWSFNRKHFHMSLQKILQLEEYLVLQHLSKSEKFLMQNNFKIICYFKFVGSWGGRIFGRQKDLWEFREGSSKTSDLLKTSWFRKASFCCVL